MKKIQSSETVRFDMGNNTSLQLVIGTSSVDLTLSQGGGYGMQESEGKTLSTSMTLSEAEELGRLLSKHVDTGRP